MMTWIPLRASDPFYDARLKAGIVAMQSKRTVDAVDALRIASFGLLDSPKELSQALALLAVAQSSLGRSTDVDATLARFVEVETRFTAYDPSMLDPPFRAQFESLLIKSVPNQTLASIPSLARMVPAQPTTGSRKGNANAAATRPAQTSAAPPPVSPPVTTTSAVPQQSVAASSSSKVPPASVPATNTADPPSVPPSNHPTAAAPTGSREGTEALARATQLLRESRPREAADILTKAVAREPDRRDLRIGLLQAAWMSSNWRLATDQVTRLKPFTDAESPSMFYASVALFETGHVTEAKDLLARALPRINRSPYVDYYVKRIGTARTGT